jgi:hypothetical protein
MPANRTPLALTLCLLALPAGLRADDAADIPTVGRPADLPFSEASGDFRVSADAEPKTVEAQKPLTVTVRVRAVAPVRRPPRRIDLRALPAFAQRFRFGEAGDGDERRPDPQTWEFVYQLLPRREDVAAVPGIPFVFYNPDIQYPRKGFQVAYTDPIPLTVKPPEIYATPLIIPPFASAAAGGPEMLQPSRPGFAPGPAVAAALLAAPPLLCAAWFVWWRRSYPDAARLARRRRSLAARRALQALQTAGRLSGPGRADRVAAVTAEYLRARFDAPAEEPTPDEAGACLARAGCPPALVRQAADVFRACDAARFAPDPEAARADLADAAARFILAVEEEPWSAPPS